MIDLAMKERSTALGDEEVERKLYWILRICFIFCGMLLIGLSCQGRDKIQVQVGPNIRVSSNTRPEEGRRNEGWIAASLEDPDFLIAVAQDDMDPTGRICIAAISKDGGYSWEEISLPEENKKFMANFPPDMTGNDGFDPLALAGTNGKMYVMYTGYPGGIPGWIVSQHPRLWVTKDKGKKWEGPTEILGNNIDHPRMAIDMTGGPYNGRLYFAWNESDDAIEKGKYHIFLHYSDDEGKSFAGPKELQCVEGGKLVMVDIMVLSDGTLIIPYYQFFYPLNDAKNEKQPFWILTSSDGGKTFVGPQKVIDIGASRSAFALPIAAADGSKESAYQDRIYVAWDDCTRTGESNIWLIWSGDKGKTWSEPLRVNDNPQSPGKGPRDFRVTPVVAVNRDGIVGVAWYDRRDDPTRRCWNYYMAFSQDGGQTFGKNIKVSSAPSCPDKDMAPSIRISEPFLEISFDRGRSVWPGHYTGLTADLNGRFHPLWADRRNGIQQLYTAVVEVSPNPPEIPKDLQENDITNKVRLTAEQMSFNEDKGISTFYLQIQNISDQPIYAPLKLKASDIKQGLDEIETLEALNADNKLKKVGAEWDFSSLMGTENRLDPKEKTEAKKIEIRAFARAGLDGKLKFQILGKVKKRSLKSN